VTQRVQARILGLAVRRNEARPDLDRVPVQADDGSVGNWLAAAAGNTSPPCGGTVSGAAWGSL
jgi:hypothetical protein